MCTGSADELGYTSPCKEVGLSHVHNRRDRLANTSPCKGEVDLREQSDRRSGGGP
jgi:hypothetical protein